MKTKLFSVHDVKAKIFYAPFSYSQVGQAVREFKNQCTNPEHNFHKNAEDFTLFHLGEFDDNSGELTKLATPEPVAKAIEFKSND